jgi:hypothetical protein
MNEETVQPIIQLLPEEYQGIAITFFGIIAACVFLYTMVIAPLMKKSGDTKMTDAISENMLSETQVGDIVNKAILGERKARAISDLANWKFKLAYATDETRPTIEAEITRLEEELRQCSNL